MNEPQYFPRRSKRCKLGMTVLLPLLIAGCEGGWILRGPFEDSHLFLNTELDNKLKDEIRGRACFNLPPKNILDTSAIERFKSSRIQIFNELFPQETVADTVFNTLRASGAQCQTENNLTQCALMKEWIYGIKELHIFGWQIGRVYLIRNSFKYLLTTKAERILNVGINIIECEAYEIDKNLYEESKTIKPIRKLP
jgi:hypothetical protein